MIRPALIFSVLTAAALVALADSLEMCPFDWYDPCRCQRDSDDYYITCYSVPADQIRAAFERTNVTDHRRLQINERNATAWPANLLADKRVREIAILCENSLRLERVDVDAFRSSENLTTFVWLDSCDLTSPQFDFHFLTNFAVLESMEISFGRSSVFPPMPLLPNLRKWNIRLSSGLRQWYQPEQTPALVDIRLFNMAAADDEPIRTIMQSLTFYNQTLQKLALEYVGLTRIPHQLRSFGQLHSLTLRGDAIAVLWPGDLQMSAKVQNLDLASSSIAAIEPGAIQGDFSWSAINLMTNQLTLFREKVFGHLLQSMAEGGGTINLFGLCVSTPSAMEPVPAEKPSDQLSNFCDHFDTDNPIVCNCDLAWLVCDYRHLLSAVVGGTCVNGTPFHQLTAYGFRSCSSSCSASEPTSPTTTSNAPTSFIVSSPFIFAFSFHFFTRLVNVV